MTRHQAEISYGVVIGRWILTAVELMLAIVISLVVDRTPERIRMPLVVLGHVLMTGSFRFLRLVLLELITRVVLSGQLSVAFRGLCDVPSPIEMQPPDIPIDTVSPLLPNTGAK